MDLERQPRALSPHSIAAMASALVLLVSLGLGVYFIEVRGSGLQAVMATGQAREIFVLFAFVGIVTIVGHLAVASAVRVSSPRTYRLLLRQALEDGLENAALDDELDDVPELRELLEMAATERARAQEITQQLQAVRRDLSELLVGMERSRSQLEPLRADQTSDIALKMAQLWNALVEQARRVPAMPPAGAVFVAPAPAAPLAVAQQAGAAPPVLDESAQRLGRLESELGKLWDVLAGRSAAAESIPPLAPEALLQPEPELPATAASWGTVEAPIPGPVGGDLLESVTAVDDAFAPDRPLAGEMRTRSSVWEPRGLMEPLGTAAAPSAAVPPRASEPRRGSEPSVASDPSSAAVPWNLAEPLSASAAASPFAAPSDVEMQSPTARSGVWDPSGLVPPRGPAEDRRQPGPASTVPPSPGWGRAAAGSPAAAAAPPEEDFDKLRFPHFVGKPVGRIAGRVEVTYDADGDTPSRLPDETLLFEPEDESPAEGEPIVDLRSLGAVEFDD